jgi:hypothetical protein
VITGGYEGWQRPITLRAHHVFERAAARGWFGRIATEAGVSWALLQCKEDSMAGAVQMVLSCRYRS